MTVTRKEFLQLLGCLTGGLAVVQVDRGSVLGLAKALDDLGGGLGSYCRGHDYRCEYPGLYREDEDTKPTPIASPDETPQSDDGVISPQESERIFAELGAFNEIGLRSFSFDEGKYSSLKRQIAQPEWTSKNRHLPIVIPKEILNRPGERSPQALMRVIDYTGFGTPRYVSGTGERASMCNIAAWDWSRALQVHLPHWIGETEMSASMLFRWISHSQAGGIYGEGWQPVDATAAQLLANRGIPVFALVESPNPGRHGHVALVYPVPEVTRTPLGQVAPTFASVRNGRRTGSNGIMGLQSAFRSYRPTYFVHKIDFIVDLQS
jgi:hypothetical protein